jgi:hypothetical protein
MTLINDWRSELMTVDLTRLPRAVVEVAVTVLPCYTRSVNTFRRQSRCDADTAMRTTAMNVTQAARLTY